VSGVRAENFLSFFRDPFFFLPRLLPPLFAFLIPFPPSGFSSSGVIGRFYAIRKVSNPPEKWTTSVRDSFFRLQSLLFFPPDNFWAYHRPSHQLVTSTRETVIGSVEMGSPEVFPFSRSLSSDLPRSSRFPSEYACSGYSPLRSEGGLHWLAFQCLELSHLSSVAS